MSSFADAINFKPPSKSSKKSMKVKSSKFVKHGKGKPGKPGKNGKSGKGRKPGKPKQQMTEPEPSGSGSAGNKAKKKEEAIDMEQQFILRMPPGPAMALRRDVQSGAMNLKDKLAVEFEQDMRHARVTYGGQVLNARLVDLPSTIQSMKTTDMKTFYNTADISQMVVCISDDEDNKDTDQAKKKDKDSKWKWNHGITPPLKNVRKRRFRKTMKKKSQEQPDIEKEVRRLFRMDCEAIDVKWEVVIEDGTSNNPESSEKQVLAQGGTGNVEVDDGKGIMDLGEDEIFGEVSSSEEEEDDEKDVNIVDSEDELRAGDADNTMQSADFNQDNTSMSDGGDVNLNIKMQELTRTIDELRNRRLDLEMQLDNVDNYLLKERLQGELNSIMVQENQKEQEYQILSSMFNQ